MNAKDPLEEFVRNNRDAMDVDSTPDRVWEGVDRRLRQRPLVLPLVRHAWKIAAVFVVLIALAWRFLSLGAPVPQDPPQMADMQNYYDHQIALRIATMETQGNGGVISARMLIQRQDGDPAFQQIRQAFRENPCNAQVRDALYRYYQSQLNILDQMSGEIHPPIAESTIN